MAYFSFRVATASIALPDIHCSIIINIAAIIIYFI